jgi:hypothetical protein
MSYLFVFSVAFYAATPVLAVQGNSKTLGQVKKIFVESYDTSSRERHVGRLEAELRRNGFDVVADPSQADAILSSEAQLETTLHGDRSIPDRAIFNYQLVLPDKTVIWKHSVKFVTKKNLFADSEYAAKKIAKKLIEDRQRAVNSTR